MLTEPIIPLAAPISSTNIATVSTIPSSIPSSTTTTTTLSTEKEQQSKMQIDEHPSETTSMSTLVAKTNNLSLDATTTQPLAPQLPPKNNDFEANLKGSFFRDFIVRNSPTTNVYSFLDKNKLTTKTFSCFGKCFA